MQDIPQGEGGDQGDPLMPLLFSFVLHPSLRSAANLLREREKTIAFLDDVCIVCTPDRVLEVFRIVENSLWTHSRISVYSGKTQLWNRSTHRMQGTHQSCPSGASTSSRVVRSKFASRVSPFWDHQWAMTSSSE